MRNLPFYAKTGLLAAAISGVLYGCSDGDDGKDGEVGPQGEAGVNGSDGENKADGKLTRLATVPQGAEVTGIFLTDAGDLFFNVQHPSDENSEVDSLNGRPFDRGTVGVLAGVNFNELPAGIPNSPVPSTDMERQIVLSALGEYQILGQTNDTFGDCTGQAPPDTFFREFS